MLGVRLVHSKPYSPQGRGKQERLNRYIRERFLTEIEHTGIDTLAELNDRFEAWVEQVANRRIHAETGQAQSTGGTPDPSIHPDPVKIVAAFRWAATRKVTTTATISLEGNIYAVDPALVGRRVEVRYDPEDLTRLDIYLGDRPAGCRGPVHDRPSRRQDRAPSRPPGHRGDRDRLPRAWSKPHTRTKRSARSTSGTSPSPASTRRSRWRDERATSYSPGSTHFGLTRTPFGKNIPANQLFGRDAHAEAVARIQHCVHESALGVITGEVGAGKTVAVRAAVATARPHPPPHHLHPQPGVRDPWPLRHHRHRARGDTPVSQSRSHAPSRHTARERRNRTPPTPRDHRRRSPPPHPRTTRRTPPAHQRRHGLAITLSPGSSSDNPALARQLRMGIFAALDQRIAIRYQLKPLDLAETAGYLRHHLTLAGRTEPLFADDAIARLHRVANGLPRQLNNAATAALIAAATPAKTSSTTPPPRVQPPNSPETDSRNHPCRTTITQPGRPMCKQRGRQHLESAEVKQVGYDSVQPVGAAIDGLKQAVCVRVIGLGSRWSRVDTAALIEVSGVRRSWETERSSDVRMLLVTAEHVGSIRGDSRRWRSMTTPIWSAKACSTRRSMVQPQFGAARGRWCRCR